MMPRGLSAISLTILLATCWLPSLASQSAKAADIGPVLEQAGKAAVRSDYDSAIEGLQTALAKVRLEAPLTAQPFLLVAEPAKFYGDYAPLQATVFRRGEAIHFYMEPKNLVYPRTANGTYEPTFSVDLQVLSAAGEVLADQKEFGSFRLSSKSPLQDIFVNLKVTLTGAPPGEYKIQFIVRDANSPKAVTLGQPITLK